MNFFIKVNNFIDLLELWNTQSGIKKLTDHSDKYAYIQITR